MQAKYQNGLCGDAQYCSQWAKSIVKKLDPLCRCTFYAFQLTIVAFSTPIFVLPTVKTFFQPLSINPFP